jgi:hypothetical protein
MGDEVGLFVMLGVALVLAAGFAVFLGMRGKGNNDTLNNHEDETLRRRTDHPEGAERSHLVGNPPIDTITPDGWGGARPGEGAEPEELPEDVHPEKHDSDRRHGRH